MTKTYEVVIIGAGIIGSAIGCGLARRGWQTLNIDRHSTSGQGSTRYKGRRAL
ncbi:MAG TPA: FAD-dependent oxidoreductase [Gammaproteobacteria bacterium]|nr:FAD-dependent oxidoreductase [Gammaproteobacteria bacterium]